MNEKGKSIAEESTEKAIPPEHGADSQLHCYNAVSWRLAEMFGEDDEPEAPKKK